MAGISDFYRGQSVGIGVKISGTLFLDGTATLQLRARLEDDPAAFEKTAAIEADGDDCEAQFALTPQETGEIDIGGYYCDVRLISSNGAIDITIPPAEYPRWRVNCRKGQT